MPASPPITSALIGVTKAARRRDRHQSGAPSAPVAGGTRCLANTPLRHRGRRHHLALRVDHSAASDRARRHSGAVAGLVAITPACGFVTPMSALVIGGLAGIFCFLSSSYLKKALGYDDALDTFGVHGVGGTWVRSPPVCSSTSMPTLASPR